MATAWIKALHKGGGNSIAAALDRSTDYISAGDKTNDGELIEGYECDPFTAASEFLFSKRQYEQITGRDQGARDVIAYHIRMSFKPEEITAEKALELGKKLAMRWTRGKHQFLVAAHINTGNPHVHVIYNSVNLNNDGKYQDFKGSAFALRRLSDTLCLEHGLSIIEKPSLSKGRNYQKYVGCDKPTTVRDQLRGLVDSVLPACKDFNSFLVALQEAGVEVKQGKQLSFKLPGGKRFTRQDTLGDDYSETAILERLAGTRTVVSKQTTAPVVKTEKPNILIDIEAKIQQGYGTGFVQYAQTQNLKSMARTLIFLQEHGITDRGMLTEKVGAVTDEFNSIAGRISTAEKRMDEISELQEQIGVYSRTRKVYDAYRDSKWSGKFYNANAADIILHKATKKYFDGLGLKKLPPMQSLKQEWVTLDAERKQCYSKYKQAKSEMADWQRVKANVDSILGEPRQQDRIHLRDER